MRGAVFRPTMTAALIWLCGAPTATADEARVRVNIFAGPQNIGLLVAQEKGLFARRGLSVSTPKTTNAASGCA